MKLLTSDNI